MEDSHSWRRIFHKGDFHSLFSHCSLWSWSKMFVAKLRIALRRTRLQWRGFASKARHFWSKGPAGDCFGMLNLLLLFAGIRTQLAFVWSWERRIRYIVHVISVYHSIIIVLCIANALTEKDDVYKMVFSMIELVGMVSAYLKILLLTYHADPVDKVEEFIKSEPMESGDPQFDLAIRSKFLRTAVIMMRFLFCVLILDEILFAIPNAQRSKLFELPAAMSSFAMGWKGCLAIFFYVKWMPLIWLSKYLCCTMKLGVLLMGYRAEYKILGHRLELIVRQAQDFESAEVYCKFLNRELTSFQEKQALLNRNLDLIRPLLGKAFFMIYYYCLFFIGTMLYVTHRQGFELYSLVFATSVVVTLMECYWWCQLIDSFQDVADAMGNHLNELCVMMPYDRKRHSEYKMMRSNLMIIWINTSRAPNINCVGIFAISTSIFVKMLNTSYSVLMFLINLG